MLSVLVRTNHPTLSRMGIHAFKFELPTFKFELPTGEIITVGSYHKSYTLVKYNGGAPAEYMSRDIQIDLEELYIREDKVDTPLNEKSNAGLCILKTLDSAVSVTVELEDGEEIPGDYQTEVLSVSSDDLTLNWPKNIEKTKKEQLLDDLIDDRCELFSVENTLDYLIDRDFSREELVLMHFDEEDVIKALLRNNRSLFALKAKDIEFDTDDEEEEKELAEIWEDVSIESGVDMEDINDIISETTGYCHRGATIEVDTSIYSLDELERVKKIVDNLAFFHKDLDDLEGFERLTTWSFLIGQAVDQKRREIE